MARTSRPRCLNKDPEDRWQSMRDIVIELRNPPQQPENITASARPPLGWIVAGCLALALAITGWRAGTRPEAPRPLIRFNAEISPDSPLARVAVFGYAGGNMLALSPDGTRLVLTLRGPDGKVRLHIRSRDQAQIVQLAGTENAYSPFFSPAGDWIAFFADGKLKKIPTAGGAAQTLCDSAVGIGGSWGDDGNIIAALGRSSALSRIPATGGTPVPVTKLNPGEASHRWPQVLPGAKAVLFTASSQVGAGYDDASIDSVSLQTGERKTILREGFFGRYAGDASSGHLLYLHQATLLAIPFHPARLAVAGQVVPILEDVNSTMTAGGDLTLSQDGTLAYLTGMTARAALPISWLDRNGGMEPLYAPPGGYFSPRFSPDGKRLAYSAVSAKGLDVWVKDLDRDAPSRLSFLPGMNGFPVWTPDGKTVVFRSNNPAAPGLYGVRSDGSAEPVRLTNGGLSEHPYSFSPDGKWLAVHQSGNGGSYDIFTIPVEGVNGDAITLRSSDRRLFLASPFDERNPAISPDGHWLAYASNESGILEIYVRPFPGLGARWLVSVGGGHFPSWSRDGRELLYESPDQKVMALSYTARGDSFVSGRPRPWSDASLTSALRSSSGSNSALYDLAPDGKRLAAIVSSDASGRKPVTHLTFLLNFLDELRRRAPLDK